MSIKPPREAATGTDGASPSGGPVAGPAAPLLARHLAGDISAEVALAALLAAVGDVAVARAAVLPAAAAEPRLAPLAALLEAHAERCAPIAPLLLEHPDPELDRLAGDAALAACRSFFDRAVRQSEEASVALYSLGDPEILARATAEVVDLFDRWGLLTPDRTALEVGCGIGRVQAALAPRLRGILGVDLSLSMLATAHRRRSGDSTSAPPVGDPADRGRLAFVLTAGRDLAFLRAGRFDLVYAVDSFPYLHSAGPGVVAAHVAEVARLLRPGGDLAILNFSYRGDLDLDSLDLAELCDAHGLVPEVLGQQPFALWDGAAFLARKPRG